MTSWPEQPPTGQPQAQTRRQAREFERSRRAGTAEPTPAGQIPEMTTSGQRAEDQAAAAETAGPETAGTETAASQTAAAQTAAAAPAAERPAIPASAFAEPGVSSPSGDSFGLFRQASDPSQPEPVTQPMAILQPANSAPAAASSAPVSSTTTPSAGDATPERTLTRRELRAMLQAQEANAQANHPATVGDPVFPVTFTSGPESEAAKGAEDSAAASSATAVPTEADAPATSEKSAWPFAPLTPSSAPGASRTAEPETTVTQSATSPFAAFGAPSAPKAETPAPAPAAAVAAEPEEDTSAQERRPFTPPTGHWSTAAELDDQNQPITTRNVTQSTAATTTNALILPVIPQPDVSSPLTQTGEILVTGSIDLPRGMGATGAHPDRIDSSDIDRLLDGEENEFNTSEVQPVRASRAISTHTSTRGVIAPPKKRGNALPVILMTVAGVLAVGVIGLLVAAYVLKVF
ncbi:hypothetical protein [Leifsonia sp. NPDC077715]|uniref:hypothetical protein n=1 Tax=Leifsonia sp. NPDC077715 TaxID=3155539 RepID=UPI0034225087